MTVSRDIQASPMNTALGPTSRGMRTVTRLNTREVTAAARTIPAVNGTNPTPVLTGLHPSTFCMNWVRKNNMEKAEVAAQSIMA